VQVRLFPFFFRTVKSVSSKWSPRWPRSWSCKFPSAATSRYHQDVLFEHCEISEVVALTRTGAERVLNFAASREICLIKL